ncbi:MAG: heat shock protein Hsp20 [Candidatus Solibacter sp.]|nr:heat shock protein Hsp20 [Candidatus Solibacter sp.]
MAQSQTATEGQKEKQNQTNQNPANQKQSESESAQVARNQQSGMNQESGTLSRRRQDPFLSPQDLYANPFSIMRRMSEEMDRVFGGFGGTRGRSGASGLWSPAIEVAERDGKYIIHAELPGLKPEEVKVEVADDALIIQGERKAQFEENQGGIQRSERIYGQFYRAIPLPQGVNPEQVRAKFENGVLEVTVPAPQEQSNRRQIPVQSGSGRPNQ